MKKVALYVRVSTQEQAAEGYSIQEQTDRLKKYCEAHDWTVVYVYTDPGFSGSNMERPALKKLFTDADNGVFDTVLVYKLDRLSRSQKDTLYIIEDVFLKNGIDFVSMNENFDTSTPFGRAMIGILSVFAQLERDQIRERMSMGKSARAKEGKWHGGSTEPICYNYDSGNLVLDGSAAVQLNEACDLLISGTPIRTIERVFRKKGYRHKYGEWTSKTLRRVMRNKVNLGMIQHNGEWYHGHHEPAITEEKFNRVNDILDARYATYQTMGLIPGKQTTYLGGLLICAHCGGKYAKQSGKKWKDNPPPLYYTCYSRSKKVMAMVKNPNCKNKNWKMEVLDNIVFTEIEKLATDHDYIRDIRNENPEKSVIPNRIEFIRNEIKKIDSQISRYMDLYALGSIPIQAIESKIKPLSESKENLSEELNRLSNEEEAMTDEEVFEIAQSFSEVFDRGDFNEIRSVIESLISYIELDNDDVTIHWKFS